MFSYFYGKFLHCRFLDACRIFEIIPKKRRLVSSYVKFDKLSENNLIFLLSLIIASQLPIFKGTIKKIIFRSTSKIAATT